MNATERIMFAIPTLHGGGAQRVLVSLLRHLPREQFEIHLAVLNREGPLGLEVPPDIVTHDLKCSRARHCVLPLWRLTRRLSPAVLLTTITRMNLIASMLKPALLSRTALAIREVNVVEELIGHGRKRHVVKAIMANRYRQVDTVVCQSEFMQRDLSANLRVPRDRMVTIYNPVDIQRVQSLAANESPYFQDGTGPHVVGIGSLHRPKKGFDRLVGAFPALLKKHPGAQLWILGDGPLKEKLKDQARSLGIAKRVHLPGFQRNPYPWLQHADLFVLASRHEGTPNVLLEAMASRCPVLALEHPGGTRELLELTGQGERMVPCLDAWEDDWFERPSVQTFDLVRKNFNADRIVQQYSGLFSRLANCRSSRIAA